MKSSLLAYSITSPTGTASSDLGDIIGFLLPVAFTLGGILLLGYLIMGGFTYLTAGGDDKRVGEAKKMITNAIIGMVIIFTSYWVIQIVETVLGLDIT